MSLKTNAERIASLETIVTYMAAEQMETNKKLDDLLVLRHKGVGAFWLASSLAGMGLFGLATAFFNWIKG